MSSSNTNLNFSSFQLKNVLESFHQGQDVDQAEDSIPHILDGIRVISHDSLISCTQSQCNVDPNSTRVLKSYLSLTCSLMKFNPNQDATSTRTTLETRQKKLLLSTLLAVQFIRQLGLNHPLLSSSTSSSLLEQWLNSTCSILSTHHQILFLSNPSSALSVQLLASTLDLVANHLLGSKSGLKADVNRNLVVKNVPKVANLLLNWLSQLEISIGQAQGLSSKNQQMLSLILSSLDLQLLLHTSLYRPLSSKIHSKLLQLLFTSPYSSSISNSKHLVRSISIILSHLHLTGVPASVTVKPSAHNSNNQARTSQPVLWKSTIDSILGSCIETWNTFIKGFPALMSHDEASQQAMKINSKLDLKPLNQENLSEIQTLRSSLTRLRILMGEKGLLETLLTTSTNRYVPLPAFKIMAFSCQILSTIPPSETDLGFDTSNSSILNSSLFSFQKSNLIEVQSMALKIGLMTLSIMEDQLTISQRDLGPRFLETILAALSNKTLNRNSNFKNLCFKSLSILTCEGELQFGSGSGLEKEGEGEKINGIGLLLDPNDRNLIKLARFSLGQIARFLNPSSSSHASFNSSTSSSSSSSSASALASGRQIKKAKISSDRGENEVNNYHSIEQHLWPNFSVQENDFQSTRASLYILMNLYPFFQTKLNQNLKELESMTHNVILALTELLLNNRCLGVGNISLLTSRKISTFHHLEQEAINPSLKRLNQLTSLCISSLNHILKFMDDVSAPKVIPRVTNLMNRFSSKGNSLGEEIVNRMVETREILHLILLPRNVPFVSSDELELQLQNDQDQDQVQDQDQDENEAQDAMDSIRIKKGKGGTMETGLNNRDRMKLDSWGIKGTGEGDDVEVAQGDKDEDEGEEVDENPDDENRQGQGRDEDGDSEMKEIQEREKEIQNQKKRDLKTSFQNNHQDSSDSNGNPSNQPSPEPIKSIRRPSTPRIGSPNSRNRVLSSSSSPSSASPDRSIPGLDAKEIFGGLQRQADKAGQRNEQETEKQEIEIQRNRNSQTTLLGDHEIHQDDDDNEDDDDEAIPEIDMRGSDDESDG